MFLCKYSQRFFAFIFAAQLHKFLQSFADFLVYSAKFFHEICLKFQNQVIWCYRNHKIIFKSPCQLSAIFYHFELFSLISSHSLFIAVNPAQRKRLQFHIQADRKRAASKEAAGDCRKTPVLPAASPFRFYSSTPRCSSRILMPIRMSTAPPNSSARDLYLRPNTWPILMPMQDRIKVVAPIKQTAGRMLT